MLGFTVALAGLGLGLGNAMKVSPFVLAIASGVVFTWDGYFPDRVEESNVQEAIDTLFSFGFFILLGASVPWGDLNTPDLPIWKLILMGIAVLAVRRLPAVLALYPAIGSLKTAKEAIFVGFFGPIGVAAVWRVTAAYCYSLRANPRALGRLACYIRKHCPQSDPRIFPTVLWIVVISVVGHGLSVPLLAGMLLETGEARLVEQEEGTGPDAGDRRQKDQSDGNDGEDNQPETDTVVDQT
jgi:CPA1 family monovalent cation:H+ antiporter